MDDNVREKILLTSLKLFNEFGFHGTSTSKIAKASGVSNGALFNRFKTKEELINEIYRHVKLDFKQYLDRKFDKNLEIGESMKSLWKSAIQWGITNPDYLKFQEQFNNSPYASRLDKENTKNGLQAVCEKKELLKNETGISDEELNLLVVCMAGATNALSFYLINNEVDDLDGHIDKAFDLLFKGILK
ncbi:TetR/AcrR family transcriptional regulator [Wukongibacter baidiensis]|uniref:TetR/AcrR family transcriptional regulator n=1 Tax=Wukongibacter baidiensis TaxID=1723361 RepID=UPI003D7FAD0E